ncbi:MAG: TAXI family TRAP transporter solute-binding subunit [Thermofilaceae archaeon]
MSSEKVSRREYLKYLGSFVAGLVIAGGGVAAYYTSLPSKERVVKETVTTTVTVTKTVTVTPAPTPTLTPIKAKIIAGAGSTGGVFYYAQGALAKVLSKYNPEIEVTVQVTGASVDNCKLLGLKKIDVGLADSTIAYNAYHGIAHFKDVGKIPLRTIMAEYPSPLHLVTIEGIGINSVKDLVGKKVSIGGPGSATQELAPVMLKVYGITEKDFEAFPLDPTKSAEALKDRRIDAFFISFGVPAAAIKELCATPGIKVKLIKYEKDKIEEFIKQFPPGLYFIYTLPAGTYPGIDYDIPMPAAAATLVCHADMDENLVYIITKTLIEHREEMAAIHPALKALSPEFAVSGSGIPFHPGAIKYYKEIGVWKE